MAIERSNVGNVPNLRFPEFEREWVQVPFDDIATFLKGKGISKDDLSETGTPCILYGELYTRYKHEVIDEIFSKTDIDPQGLVASNKNDVLIPSSGESAIEISTACCINKDGVLLGGDLNIIRPFRDSGSFISYQLNGKRKQDIAKIAQGSSVVHLYNESLRKLKIWLSPEDAEQQKIASFLSLIDERIDTQRKIIENLETALISLRDRIFVQKLRFRNALGGEFSDWQTRKLGDICQKISSNISANKIEDNFGDYIIYGASGPLKRIDFYSEKTEYIAIVKDGAGVGRLFFCEGKSSVLGTMDIIKPKNGTDTYFLSYLLQGVDFKKYTTGSTIPHIYFRDYQHENCAIPSVEEQSLIAQFLFGFDKKIQVERTLLNLYQNQKTFFLDGLFI